MVDKLTIGSAEEMKEYEKSTILETLQFILGMKDKIGIVSDMAFEAVDDDESDQIDLTELGITLKSVAKQLSITPPTEIDIEAVLNELDQDGDNEVSKEEFETLITKVLEKMWESEIELQSQIKKRRDRASLAKEKEDADSMMTSKQHTRSGSQENAK